MNRLAVIGAGSWGTALAIALSSRFETVALWARRADHAADIRHHGENRKYLPNFPLPRKIEVFDSFAPALAGATIALSVVPSAFLRGVLFDLRPRCSPALIFVSATKGIEEETLASMSQVYQQVLPSHPVAVLSGPTFAKEVAAGEPAAVVIAATDLSLAESIQRAFSTPALRFYTSPDVVGVELGAALKNVIAIAAGICRGLGLGSNSVAALVTRGLAEITRLAVAMGGNPRTLSGLAGLGDLVLTATGDLSRNRHVGIELGRGYHLEAVLSGMAMVAEGVTTCRAAHKLGSKLFVDLPIINKMYEILYESKDVRQAIRELMDRPLTSE